MGVLAPWYLGGLLALGVPVFVHLLRRHVTTPRPVGSLMFFERGTQSSTRHRRLRYLLLFALRFALLLLLVLAFADPFIRRPAANPSGRLMLIVVDRSFSMRAGTRFVDAKRQALELLAGKPAKQKAQVMVLAGQLEILTEPVTDPQQLRSAIESIQPGDAHASFGELGRGVRTLAETVHGPIDLHLFSDMQRTAMPANFADLLLPQNANLTVHAMTDAKPLPNWTVASVDAPAELSDVKDPRRSRVTAVIAGFNAPASTKKVSLLVGGRVLATREVSVPANGRATVEFAPLDVAYGSNRCEVRVEGGDAFAADDASVFAVRRSDPQRVLFLHAPEEARSTLYFGTALAAAAPSAFLLQSVAASLATDLDPARYAFVVVSDTVALQPVFERALDQYVDKGGSVLIALGTRVGNRARIPLWGGNVTEKHDYLHASAVAHVAEVDFTHPAVTQARPGRDNGGWAGAKIFYAVGVEGKDARVVARLSDGTPLLLDRQVGLGHVLLFTSGLDNLTNDLPLHPVFVSFVDLLARFLSGSGRLSGSRLVDSFVQLRSPAEPAGVGGGVEVIGPGGRRPLSLADARTAQTLRLAEAGFYQIRFANGRDALIGVNPDLRESDLAPMAEDVQRLWTGSSGANAGQPGGISPAVAPGSPETTKEQRVPLWWYVMLLALLTAVAETALASGYMGTQREEA